MPETVKTTSETISDEVVDLLKARNPLFWVVTREETRVELCLYKAILTAGYRVRTWDVSAGVRRNFGKTTDTSLADIGALFTTISAAANKKVEASDDKNDLRGVWIMRDLPVWLEGLGGARDLRALKNLVKELPGTSFDTAQAIVVLSPNRTVPPEIADFATVIDWPLPDRAEISERLGVAIAAQKRPVPVSDENFEAAVDAAVGLSGEEADACFAKSLVKRRIDPKLIAQEKKRVIAREGLINWYDPIPGGLDAIGGLDVLKRWLIRRNTAFSVEARAENLPMPKGVMLVGISGCGKSLTAKAAATAFGMPLLRLDLNALKNKYVGDSERNLRRVFDIIKAIGRCAIWVDEIEKALAGATQGAADGGVASDALGAILNWMQERKGGAFVIATANDISGLPPELLRKGRFDEIFFVDLPNVKERAEVAKAAMAEYGKADVKIDYAKIAAATDNFTSSEIAALVPEALFEAFDDGKRKVTTADLIAAAKEVVPLSKTAADKIKKLQDWGKSGNAKLATTPLVKSSGVARAGAREVQMEED
jgi:AAA+ superfamily predicted ATPase